MKQGYTHISIVLDRSGSMKDTASDAIGGFNAFLSDQKKAPGEATLTLVQFDDEYEVLQEMKPVKDVPELTSATFKPRGSTALLDAIGRTIDETGKSLEAMSESSRPEHVIFVVVTDGYENASMRFTGPQINEKVAHQRDAYNWQFVFIGANQDAIASAKDIGIPMAGSLTYAANSQGMAGAYASLSNNTARHRAGLTASVGFSEEDREKQVEALKQRLTK